MAKIRIGKNVGIRWRITTNGEDVPLKGRNLTLFIRHPYMQQKQLDMRVVDGNVVAAVFRGVEQHYVGVYTLTLYEDYGLDTQNITDRCDAFELVRCSCEELTTGDLSTTDIEVLVSDYIAGVEGLSAYEVAVKNGFDGSEAEWLDSLVLPAEQAAEETRQLIVEVTEAENERTASEETRQINEGTRGQQEKNRVAAEEVRVQAETKRVQAEQQRADEFAGFANTLASKEDIANKVTSINADADDVHYPSAKAVWSAIEDKFWYGVEKDVTISTPTCTRIGNMDLHRTLPVHSLMRGCLLADDGTVNKYLDPNDWTNEVRDGSQGQVMVEIPRHYRKCETEGNIIRVKLSLLPLNGFHEVPKAYVSAYEATLDRSTTTKIKLCSVVNEAAEYRGGNNNSSLDGTYKTLLGRPASSSTFGRSFFRTYARNRNTATKEWNCYTYDVHVTLWWLFVTEYATLNSQAPYNEELTADGYRQGGLGAGTTTLLSTQLTTYNGRLPFVKCGYTDNAGNKTTQAMYHIENDDASISLDVPVPRYRGVEHPFGHISKIVDGIIVVISPNSGGDRTSKAYVVSDPRLFSDTKISGYRLAGLEARSKSYIKTIQFGEFGDIVPTVCYGAGSSTYYCDSHNTFVEATEEKVIWDIGGNATSGTKAGLLYVNAFYGSGATTSLIGTRLCFIPLK